MLAKAEEEQTSQEELPSQQIQNLDKSITRDFKQKHKKCSFQKELPSRDVRLSSEVRGTKC